MKDFIKWLGVNEKIAKVAVWLLIIMVTLIIFNTAMESLGFPYYAITYDNIKKMYSQKVLEYIISWILAMLNFYSVVLLVFRLKDAKKIFKYALIYLLINILLTMTLPKIVAEIFIPLYIVCFCYFYSQKQLKYIFYSIISIITTTFVQGIWYMSKVRFINYSELNKLTQSILSIDYFIIMMIIILVKEIYLKKRSEENGNMLAMDRRIQKRKQICKENRKENRKRS